MVKQTNRYWGKTKEEKIVNVASSEREKTEIINYFGEVKGRIGNE